MNRLGGKFRWRGGRMCIQRYSWRIGMDRGSQILSQGRRQGSISLLHVNDYLATGLPLPQVIVSLVTSFSVSSSKISLPQISHTLTRSSRGHTLSTTPVNLPSSANFPTNVKFLLLGVPEWKKPFLGTPPSHTGREVVMKNETSTATICIIRIVASKRLLGCLACV